MAKFFEVMVMDGPNKNEIILTDKKEGVIELHNDNGKSKYRIITIPEAKYCVLEHNFEIMTEEQLVAMIKHKLWVESFR